MIQTIVQSFYTLALDDILIGYHFAHIADLNPHIQRITFFWNMQLLNEPFPLKMVPIQIMQAHFPLGIKRGEVGRWVKLFLITLDKHIEVDSTHQELKTLWIEKIKHFENIFLSSNQLFSRRH